MPIDILDLERGERRDFHTTLYESELEVLDQIASKYGCSRGTVIGAMVKRYKNEDLGIEPGADDRRKQRRKS